MTVTQKRQAMLRPVRLDRPVATSLARGGVYSTIGLVAQGLLRFATSFLVGHLAGKSVLGVVASAIATSLTLALLWPTTTGSAASKFLARARGEQASDVAMATAAHLRMRTLQTGILLGAVSVPVWVLIDAGSWPDALCVAALTITYSGYSFTRGIQFGAGQVQRATMWDVTSVALGLAGLVALLLAGVHNTALVLPLVATYGLYTVAGWPYHAQGRPSRPLRRELDGFVLLGAVGSLASTGFLQLSQVAAKLSAGDADAGQYASAIALATPASLLAASLTLVLLPLVATYGLYTVAGWPYHAQGRPSRPLRRELDGFVLLGAVGSLASTGFLQLSQVAAKLSAGDADAGQYASAIALATPASLLAASLTLVLLPSMSEAVGRKDLSAFRARTDSATRGLAVTMVAIFGSIMVCSRLIVGIVWGAKFAGAERLLPVLAAAVLATNLCVACVNALNSRSQRGMLVNTVSAIAGMLLGVTLWAVLAPRLGLAGVAIGYLCGTIFISAVPVALVWRRDGHRWALMFTKVLIGVLLAGGLVLWQQLAGLPLWLDPVLALGFLAVWWVLNRAEVARLPLPRPGRRR